MRTSRPARKPRCERPQLGDVPGSERARAATSDGSSLGVRGAEAESQAEGDCSKIPRSPFRSNAFIRSRRFRSLNCPGAAAPRSLVRYSCRQLDGGLVLASDEGPKGGVVPRSPISGLPRLGYTKGVPGQTNRGGFSVVPLGLDL